MILYNLQITTHKFFEFQISKYKIKDTQNWFKFSIELRTKCDHKGFYLEFTILGFVTTIMIYDNRHYH